MENFYFDTFIKHKLGYYYIQVLMSDSINVKFEQYILRLINSTKTQVFVLNTHIESDLDDYSSLMAFLEFLNQLKKHYNLKIETHICLSGNLDPNFVNLTPNSDYFWRDSDMKEYQNHFQSTTTLTQTHDVQLGIFGCSDMRRTLGNPFISFIYKIYKDLGTLSTLNFDHHINGENWADFNFVDEKLSSNAENLFEILKNSPYFKLNPEVATNLMVGLVDDTVSFFAQSTTYLTHQHAGELIELGCDVGKVREIIHAKWTIENLDKLNNLLKKTDFLDISSLVWSKSGKRNDFAVIDCLSDSYVSGLFKNEILDILKTEMVIMLKNGPTLNDHKLSIRCLPEAKINAIEIANHFGGAGHKMAAGAPMGSHDITWLKAELVKFLEKSVI